MLECTKLEVIAKQAFLLSHAVEHAQSASEVDGVRLEIQMLSVQAGQQSTRLSGFIQSLQKKAEKKSATLSVQESRQESVRAVCAQAMATPPAPGLQSTIYQRFMSYKERALFDSVTPDHAYAVIKVNDRGEIFTYEEVSGERVRTAMARVKYHSLNVKQKQQIPPHERPQGTKQKQMRELKRDLEIIDGFKTGRAMGFQPVEMKKPSPPEPSHIAANTDSPLQPSPIPTSREPKKVSLDEQKKATVRESRTAFTAAYEKVDAVKDVITQIDVEMAEVDARMPERNETEKTMKALLKPDLEKKCVAKHKLPEKEHELARTLQEDILDGVLTETKDSPEKTRERETRATKNSALAKAPTWKDTLTDVPETGNSNTLNGPKLPRNSPGGMSK